MFKRHTDTPLRIRGINDNSRRKSNGNSNLSFTPISHNINSTEKLKRIILIKYMPHAHHNECRNKRTMPTAI